MTPPVYESPLALAVALYNRPDHLPKRTCLGCGGGVHQLADGRWVWIDCGPRGVEISARDFQGQPVRYTWAQVAAAVPKQDGLGL